MLSRTIDWWEQCDPIAMAQMRTEEVEAALEDARNDILWLSKLMENRVEILHNVISNSKVSE